MSDDNEYMSLAPGVGIIPENQRNRGYDKLAFGPGEGGLAAPREQKTDSGGFDAFMAAVAAGADPQEYAKQMTTAPKPKRRAA